MKTFKIKAWYLICRQKPRTDKSESSDVETGKSEKKLAEEQKMKIAPPLPLGKTRQCYFVTEN